MFAMKNNMATQFLFKNKKKKALSTVVATVLIILLTVVSVGIVWGFVRGILNPVVTNKCYAVQTNPELVTLGDAYTCYNDTSEELQLMINIGDIEIDGLLVSVLANGASRSFILTNNDTLISNPSVRYYQSDNGGTPSVPELVKLPVKNAGLTYQIGGFTGVKKIDTIRIAPTVEGRDCEATDITNEIDNCKLFII
jgi:hypothetical protein